MKNLVLALCILGFLASAASATLITYSDPANGDDATWTRVVTFDDPMNNDDVELQVEPKSIDDPMNDDDTIHY